MLGFIINLGGINMKLLFLPFVILWGIMEFFLNLLGRLLALIVGIVLIIIGLVLTLTIVCSIIGIPLLIFGFLLMLRSIF